MMPNNNPLVVTIIVHYQSPEECATLVGNLEQLSYPNHKIVVVDNQSAPSYYQQLRDLLQPTQATLFQNKANSGYGAGINYGIQQVKHLQADFYQIINADTRVINLNYLSEIIDTFKKNAAAGLIGPCVQTLNGDIQNTIMPFITLRGVISGKHLNRSFIQTPPIAIEAEVINGVCFVVSADAYHGIGGFDEDFFMYGEEHDLCYRLTKNQYQCLFWTGLSIQHDDYESRQDIKTFTWRDALIRANQILYLKKRQQYFSAFVLSVLFSTTLLLKYLKGVKIQHPGLSAIWVGYFSPIRMNQFRSKAKSTC